MGFQIAPCYTMLGMFAAVMWIAGWSNLLPRTTSMIMSAGLRTCSICIFG
jgi:hypothetical protein